ncbi:hypothetical protein WDW37_18530 [Bdellovibrionota bacterium FG-1]
MKAVKITFYPKGEAAEALKGAPSKKVSERVNELILKGLTKEKEEQLKRDYEQYDRDLAASPPRARDAKGVSTAMIMSQRLFTEDEGSAEADQDLF